MPARTGAEAPEPEAEESTVGANVEEAKPTVGVADAEGEQATLTPQAPATATATAAPKGWSLLPVDLINCVAERLLATNDLDYYMDLRAVCQHWRSSTADPRSNDPRFRPTQWAMLNEVKHYDSRDDDSRLFVNAATGRFLQRNLPLLRNYDLITTTTGGLLILATARDSGVSTRASVRVLNPFTGSSIDFAAPMPAAPWRFTADVVGSSPTLVLVSIVSNSPNKVYWAEPQSASFSMESHTKCPASSLPLIAATKCTAVKRCSGSKASKIFNRLAADVRCRRYAVRVPGRDMLAVLKRRRGVDVFKVDSDGNVVRRVRSIGNLALFLGVRCIAVDAGMFKGIQANCVYFQMADYFSELAIYKVDIEAGAEEQEPEFVERAITYGRPYWSFHLTPFTLTQVLCNYTMDIARHPPTWELNSHAVSFFEMAPYIHLLDEDDDNDEKDTVKSDDD